MSEIPCKWCKRTLSEHLTRNYNNCPMGYKDDDGVAVFSVVNIFAPMDNLTFMEYLARRKNLV